MSATANLIAAWIGFLAGALSGMVIGLCFHRAEWLGGYGSWSRRLLRLGHIACFGLGLLNLAYAATAAHVPPSPAFVAGGWLLIAALATMAPTCWLAAALPAARHAFALPVACVLAGVGCVIFAASSLNMDRPRAGPPGGDAPHMASPRDQPHPRTRP